VPKRNSRTLAPYGRQVFVNCPYDEAYLPFLPDEDERTLIRAAATRDNLIVLRSMTKI